MSQTARQRQIADALDTRRRQVEEQLEHERFDVRVQRGEWPTAKVGELFGIEVFQVDGSAPVLAIMGFKHNVALHYESRLLGRPLDTAKDLLVECEMAWVECRKQYFVSTAGWRKLKRSVDQQRPVGVGVDLGKGDATVTVDGRPIGTVTDFSIAGRR